jgi:hypothetical protein
LGAVLTLWTGTGRLLNYSITNKVVLALREEHNNKRSKREDLVVLHDPSGCYLFQADSRQDRDIPKYVFTAEGAEWETWLYVTSEDNIARAAAIGITLDPFDWRGEFAFRERYGNIYYARYPLDDTGKVPTPWSTELTDILAHLVLIGRSYFASDSRKMLPDSFDFCPPNIPEQFHHYFEHLLTGKPQS